MALAAERPMAPRPSRFEARLGLVSTLVIATICVGLSWQLARSALADLRRNLELRGTSVVTVFAREAAEAMQRSDLDALAEAAARAHSQSDVVAVSAFDAQGLVLAATGSSATIPLPSLDDLPESAVEVPGVGLALWRAIPSARAADAAIGAVTVSISLEPLAAMRHRILVTATALTLLFMLIGAAAAFAVARALTRPLAELARATDAIAGGDFSARVAVRRADEVGTVATAFNVMAESLARSRRALEDKLHELERANHLKSEFLATVSHELRTPLNVIIGHSEMLDDATLGSTEHAELIATIRRYAHLQLDLVTSVLDFERLAAGGVTCRVEPFALGPLVTDVLALQTSRTRPGVQLQARVDPECPTLETDRIKVHQILRNLVDNAVKFTESGRIMVEAGPGPREGWLALTVTDTGPGVPEAELPYIFEPFHQIGESSTRTTSGVGLGLSIVQQIVVVLGGEITVSSELGWGSTFRVALPCRLPEAARNAADQAGTSSAQRAA
jgi:signal transduction histidine kinase